MSADLDVEAKRRSVKKFISRYFVTVCLNIMPFIDCSFTVRTACATLLSVFLDTSSPRSSGDAPHHVTWPQSPAVLPPVNEKQILIFITIYGKGKG